MEVIGYDNAEPRYRLRTVQTRFLEKMEQEHGTSIRVKYGAASVISGFDEDDPFDGITIYDYATKREGTTSPRALRTVRVPDGDVGTGGRAHNLDVIPYLIASSDAEDADSKPIGCPGQRTLGSVGMRKIWIGTPLVNFGTELWLKRLLEGPIKKALDVKYWEEKLTQQFDEVKQRFMSAGEAALQRDVTRHKENLTNLESQVGSLGNQIIALYRQIRDTQRRMEFAEQKASQDTDFYEKQFSELLKNKKISKIRFNRDYNRLDLYTHDLYIYSPNRKERAPLGQMRIGFNQDGTVNIKNVSNAKGGRPHPHVDANGTPCWGAAQTQVSKMAATGEIVGLFEVAVNYLEQYNPHDDSARHGILWFTDASTEVKQEDGSFKTVKELEKIENETADIIPSSSVSEAELDRASTGG